MQLSWSLLKLVTQEVSGIIMPIIRSTRRDDKPHTVFCTGRINTTIKCTRVPPHLLKSTAARQVQNTVCGLSSLLVLLLMGIMMPETFWVTIINKLQLNFILLVPSSPLHELKFHLRLTQCHWKISLTLTTLSGLNISEFEIVFS
jgi:hypothetical protein